MSQGRSLLDMRALWQQCSSNTGWYPGCASRLFGIGAELTRRLWKHFIPEDLRHVFERGVYYSVEVIPDRLAVISLNTLFWYDSNTCALRVYDCRSPSRARTLGWTRSMNSD